MTDLEVLLQKQSTMKKIKNWCYKKGYNDTAERTEIFLKEIEKAICKNIPL